MLHQTVTLAYGLLWLFLNNIYFHPLILKPLIWSSTYVKITKYKNIFVRFEHFCKNVNYSHWWYGMNHLLASCLHFVVYKERIHQSAVFVHWVTLKKKPWRFQRWLNSMHLIGLCVHKPNRNVHDWSLFSAWQQTRSKKKSDTTCTDLNAIAFIFTFYFDHDSHSRWSLLVTCCSLSWISRVFLFFLVFATSPL